MRRNDLIYKSYKEEKGKGLKKAETEIVKNTIARIGSHYDDWDIIDITKRFRELHDKAQSRKIIRFDVPLIFLTVIITSIFYWVIAQIEVIYNCYAAIKNESVILALLVFILSVIILLFFAGGLIYLVSRIFKPWKSDYYDVFVASYEYDYLRNKLIKEGLIFDDISDSKL